MSEVVMFNPAAYGGAASGGGGAQAYNPIAPQGGTRRDYIEDNPETDYEREQRFLVMKAIENGELIPDFNRRFTQFVLNQPPAGDLVRVGKLDGKSGVNKARGAANIGELAYINVRLLYGLLDSDFDSWSVRGARFETVYGQTKSGEVKKVVCTVTLEVVYPLTGLKRTFNGTFESNFGQQMAAAAALAFATKNAIGIIGRRYGRYLLEDKPFDFSTENEKTKKLTDLYGND
jgi:hypothetical protein